MKVRRDYSVRVNVSLPPLGCDEDGDERVYVVGRGVPGGGVVLSPGTSQSPHDRLQCLRKSMRFPSTSRVCAPRGFTIVELRMRLESLFDLCQRYETAARRSPMKELLSAVDAALH